MDVFRARATRWLWVWALAGFAGCSESNRGGESQTTQAPAPTTGGESAEHSGGGGGAGNPPEPPAAVNDGGAPTRGHGGNGGNDGNDGNDAGDAHDAPDATTPSHPGTEEPPPAARPDARPIVAPQLEPAVALGALAGPGSQQASGMRLYGAATARTFAHADKLQVLLGDTWPEAAADCRPATRDDDALARMPLRPASLSTPPGLAIVTQPDAADTPQPLRLLRGGEPQSLGRDQQPVAGFSDGAHAFALFDRAAAVTCDTAGATCGADSVQCSADLGLCQSDMSIATNPCNLDEQGSCPAGQTCVPTSVCIDPTSAQYTNTHFGSTAAAMLREIEIGKLSDNDDTTDFDSAYVWRTNKFAAPTARSVARFSETGGAHDYAPGHETLLVWGRPGETAEQGRNGALYLLAHALPLQLDDAGQLAFTPRYFAGLGDDGTPRWTERESEAQPLALDGVLGGEPREQTRVTGALSVSWLPAPIARWIMLYGGDVPDAALSDPRGSRGARAPGAILARFAEQPWGPWSPPVVHLAPGLATTPGDPAGPGGFLFHPGCTDTAADSCRDADPRPAAAGCSAQQDAPRGRLSAPNIIDAYTSANDTGGVDLVWSVSTGNPYGIQLLRTKVTPPGKLAAPSDELADRAALERMSSFRTLPQLSEHFGRHEQQSSYDRDTVDTTFPLSDHGNRDFNNFHCASADTVLPADQFAPFKLDRERCEEDYVHGVVLGRFEGSGRMIRMWLGMQSLVFAPADEEILRIYVDDEPTPRIEVPLAAALDGSAGEIFAPPFGAGSPRRLAWYYPVAFGTKLIVALDGIGAWDNYFHHCDVIYDAPESEPSSSAARERLPQRDAVQQQLDALYEPAGGTLTALHEPQVITLAAGERSEVEIAGPATIYDLQVRFEDNALAELADVWLQVRWDESEAAAIDLPLLALFGTIDVPPQQSTLALTSVVDGADRVLALQLPLPLQTRARFTFTQRGTGTATFELSARGEPKLERGTLGRLHTQRREISAPTDATEFLALEAEGRGRFVGLCGYVQGHADPEAGIQYDQLNLLEGDVRLWIDGELALNGTGTEEYASDVFYYMDAPHARPFEQVWGVVNVPEQPPGRANFCHWHVLGAELDFGESLRMTFELGGAGNPGIMEHTKTVAFYYRRD
ncbi:MAG: DUF2961 domain-containing protein [Polyangiales bacterium]